MRAFAFPGSTNTLGAMPTPMWETTGCRCHELVRQGRARVTNLAANTAAVTASVREAVASCRGVDWEGNAATLFRSRLDGVSGELEAHESAVRATARLAQGG